MTRMQLRAIRNGRRGATSRALKILQPTVQEATTSMGAGKGDCEGREGGRPPHYHWRRRRGGIVGSK